jgi:predicted metal-binding membrane protein
MDAMGGFQRAQRRDRLLLLALLSGASVACWGWTAWTAERMGAMPGHVHALDLRALFAMWAIMMVGMMIPPEVPALLQLARARRERIRRSPLPGTGAFLAGYLLPWTAFSLAAALLQAGLQARGLMDHGMATSSRTLAGALLLAAGAVQLSPLKRLCLARCRAPLVAVAGSSTAAAFRGGIRYAAIAMASCGLLMLVLFASGVMNLPLMAVLTTLLLAEKVAPPAWPLPAAVGALLLVWGGLTLVG